MNKAPCILECVIEAAANEIINVQEKLIEVGDVDCGSTVNPPPCLRPLPCLPEDIMVEILSKLPVRSLLQFRSVSKSWNRLIFTSYKRLPPAMSGFFFQNYVTLEINFIGLQSRTYIDTSLIDASLTFLPQSDIIIFDCCNGLLLLTSLHHESLYVCNPATKKWAHIPGPTIKSKYFKLVFEPIHSKNYTIICFPFVEDGGNFSDEVDVMLKVFSSHTCQWRKTYNYMDDHDFSMRVDNYMDDHDFVVHNGLLYFMDQGDIYAINTEGRLYLRIKGLDYGDFFAIGICLAEFCNLDMWDSVCLGQSGGLLHNVFFTGKRPNSELLVWALKDSHRIEYILKHRKRKEIIRQKMGRCSGKMQFQFIHPDLDVIFFKMQDNFLSQQKIFFYQMPNGKVEEICNTDGYGRFIGCTPCFREDLNLPATPSSSVRATPLVAASPIPLVQPSAIALSPTATSSPSSAVTAAHFASDTEGVGELAGHNQDTDSFKERLKKLVAIGFEKTQAEVPLTAVDGDPNVAIKILMNQQR